MSFQCLMRGASGSKFAQKLLFTPLVMKDLERILQRLLPDLPVVPIATDLLLGVVLLAGLLQFRRYRAVAGEAVDPPEQEQGSFETDISLEEDLQEIWNKSSLAKLPMAQVWGLKTVRRDGGAGEDLGFCRFDMFDRLAAV